MRNVGEFLFIYEFKREEMIHKSLIQHRLGIINCLAGKIRLKVSRL